MYITVFSFYDDLESKAPPTALYANHSRLYERTPFCAKKPRTFTLYRVKSVAVTLSHPPSLSSFPSLHPSLHLNTLILIAR